MATVIKFPGTCYASLRIRSGKCHRVAVTVTDPRHPEKTRWELQWAMQRAASFRCLKGFNDNLARHGKRHRFSIGQTWLLKRFLRDIENLVELGRVVVEIGGVSVGPARKRA